MENYDFRVQNHVLIKPYLISHERYIYVFYSVINLRSIYKILQKGICVMYNYSQKKTNNK